MNKSRPEARAQLALLTTICVAVLWIAWTEIRLAAFAQHQGQGGAAVPRLLPFKGRLLTREGEPVPEGESRILFRLYDRPTGGTSRWESTIPVKVQRDGQVEVLLGKVTSLDSVDFSEDLYLSLRVDNPSAVPDIKDEPEILPRTQIPSANYSHVAGNSTRLAGFDWTPLLVGGSNNPNAAKIRRDKIETLTTAQLGSNSVTANNIAPDAVSMTQIAVNAVGTAEIANGAVTSRKLAPATVRRSESTGTWRGSGPWNSGFVFLYLDVPNLSVTMPTSGRPVRLALEQGSVLVLDPSGVRNFSNVTVRFQRDGTTIYESKFKSVTAAAEGLTATLPSSMFNFVDTAAPDSGTHTYKVQVTTAEFFGGGGITTNEVIFSGVRFTAVEL